MSTNSIAFCVKVLAAAARRDGERFLGDRQGRAVFSVFLARFVEPICIKIATPQPLPALSPFSKQWCSYQGHQGNFWQVLFFPRL